jgi:P4 family phage/plasmid primase-like protien
MSSNKKNTTSNTQNILGADGSKIDSTFSPDERLKKMRSSNEINTSGVNQKTMIAISNGLQSTDKDALRFDSVEMALQHAETHLDSYEITNPDSNMVYVDLDGEAGDMDEETFDITHQAIIDALIGLPFNIVVAESSSFQQELYKMKTTGDAERRIVNKLSYRIHFMDKHGSKRAIQKYVVEEVFPAIKSGVELFVSNCDLSDKIDKSVFPYLDIDVSVYKGNRKMRMIGSSKSYYTKAGKERWNSMFHENRPLRIVGVEPEPEDFLITVIKEDSVALPEEVEVEVEQTPSPRNTISAPPTADPSEASEVRDDADDKAIRECLMNVKASRADNYGSWRDAGLALYHERMPIDLWIEFSKRSARYATTADAECRKMWASFKDMPSNGKKPLTQGTLWYWLRQDNPVKYGELLGMRNDFWRMLKAGFSHADVAQYFYTLKPDAYLYHEELKWFQLGSNCVWKNYEGSPSGLLSDIWATMKKEANAYNATIDITKKDDETKERLCLIKKFATTIGMAGFCKGVIDFLPGCYNVADLPNKMDESRHLFAFADKVIDLDKQEVRPIEPTDYICRNTDYKMPKSDPATRADLKKFLYSMWESQSMVDYVMKTIAQHLHGHKKQHKFYVWTGRGGNGKSLFTKLIMKSFGGLYHHFPNEVLTKKSDKKDSPNPPVARAKGARLVFGAEPEASDRLQVGTIKEFTGGDMIQARVLFGKYNVIYMPQFGLFLMCNAIPKLSAIDGGIKRRMEIVPFPLQFKDAHEMTEPHHRLKDNDLESKIMSEAWRDEFILLLMEYYFTIGDSIVQPEEVAGQTSEYMIGNNPVFSWFNEKYRRDATADTKESSISCEEMRRTFMADTGTTNECDASKFKAYLQDLGVETKRWGNAFTKKDGTQCGSGMYYINIVPK